MVPLVCIKTEFNSEDLYLSFSVLLTQSSIFPTANLTNVALGKPASQYPESIHRAWAGIAVDGIDYTNFLKGDCTHTSPHEQNKPWWSVDLGGDFTVVAVSVLNRGDCCCKFF